MNENTIFTITQSEGQSSVTKRFSSSLEEPSNSGGLPFLEIPLPPCVSTDNPHAPLLRAIETDTPNPIQSKICATPKTDGFEQSITALVPGQRVCLFLRAEKPKASVKKLSGIVQLTSDSTIWLLDSDSTPPCIHQIPHTQVIRWALYPSETSRERLITEQNAVGRSQHALGLFYFSPDLTPSLSQQSHWFDLFYALEVGAVYWSAFYNIVHDLDSKQISLNVVFEVTNTTNVCFDQFSQLIFSPKGATQNNLSDLNNYGTSRSSGSFRSKKKSISSFSKRSSRHVPLGQSKSANQQQYHLSTSTVGSSSSPSSSTSSSSDSDSDSSLLIKETKHSAIVIEPCTTSTLNYFNHTFPSNDSEIKLFCSVSSQKFVPGTVEINQNAVSDSSMFVTPVAILEIATDTDQSIPALPHGQGKFVELSHASPGRFDTHDCQLDAFVPGENIRVPMPWHWDQAALRNVSVQKSRTSFRYNETESTMQENFLIKLTNHRIHPSVSVVIEESAFRTENWHLVETTHEYAQVSPSHFQFEVDVPFGRDVHLSYGIFYTLYSNQQHGAASSSSSALPPDSDSDNDGDSDGETKPKAVKSKRSRKQKFSKTSQPSRQSQVSSGGSGGGLLGWFSSK